MRFCGTDPFFEAKAEQILGQELRRRGWDRRELERRRKSDQEKIKMARRLRSETTMTLNWIAERLKMGVSGYAASCLRDAMKTKKYALLRD